MALKFIQKTSYETEDEDWAFSDGVKAGVKAMCEKYNINEEDVYRKDADHENTGVKDNLTKEEREAVDEVGRLEPLDDWMKRTEDADHENTGVKKQ